MNNILKTTALLLGSSVLLSGCIKETFPESGYATSDQTAESPFAKEGLITAMPTVLITNYIDLGEHIDFGYPGIFGATDRMVGEVFPVSGNLPGGNQYYDRWQAWLYPGNSTGLAANGKMSPFFYTNYYKFIFTANEAIDIANQSEGAEEMMGIAKTFRALCYLDLARLYDALPAKAPERPAYETELEAVKGLTVPIVREDTSMEELENNPRVSREEMFKFIFEDLNTAETLLANYTPATKNLPSLAVIYGLKARAYLWLGGFTESYAEVPTGDAAYRLAAEYARKAIDASGCTIMTESQWLDPKTGFNTVNSSWMWAMIQTTDTVLNNLLSWSAHMATEAIWGYGYGAQPGISVFSYNRISSGDFRKKSFVGADRSFDAIAPYTTLTEEEFATIAPYASFKFHAANGEKRNYSTGNVTSIPMMRRGDVPDRGRGYGALRRHHRQVAVAVVHGQPRSGLYGSGGQRPDRRDHFPEADRVLGRGRHLLRPEASEHRHAQRRHRHERSPDGPAFHGRTRPLVELRVPAERRTAE